jgi:uncharacterized protein (UPF0335 family)
MLVVASVIIFLTLLVQTIGGAVGETLAAQRLQLINRVERLEEKLGTAQAEYRKIRASSGLLKKLVIKLVLVKIKAL